jgi:Family of unknown function (DUF6232)
MAYPPIFESANAMVTDTDVTIRDQSFPVAKITGVSMWDERPKAKRWMLIGVASGAVALFISFMASQPTSSFSALTPLILRVIGDITWAVGVLILVISTVAWLLFSLKKSAGTGLVIEMADGKSEMIDGIARDEVSHLHSAIESTLACRKREEADEGTPAKVAATSGPQAIKVGIAAPLLSPVTVLLLGVTFIIGFLVYDALYSSRISTRTTNPAELAKKAELLAAAFKIEAGWLEGTKLEGRASIPDYYRSPKAAQEQCASHCTSNDSCQGFMIDKKSNRCDLFSTVERVNASMSTSSDYGIRPR